MSDQMNFWTQYCAPWLRARRAFLFEHKMDVSFWIGVALGVGFAVGRLA